MSGQSDRNLPRTNFFTDYTWITRKNGHEMEGLLIVYIMVMTSFEEEYLDQTLGQEWCSAFIYVIECNLLMEKFCKSQSITWSEMKLFQRGIPLILATFINVINQQEG